MRDHRTTGQPNHAADRGTHSQPRTDRHACAQLTAPRHADLTAHGPSD